MSQKSKVEIEEKVKGVRMYLAGQINMNELARKLGINWFTAAAWVRNYQAEGLDAFIRHKNHTYSRNVKQQAVREYQRGGGSLSDIYSTKHLGGRSHMKQGRETTLKERIQIARECIACGKKYSEMALKYQVSYQQVRSWTLRFEQMGEAGLEDRRGRRKKDQTPRTELEQAQIEIEQLQHKLYLAEMENALLKKLDEIERRDASRK